MSNPIEAYLKELQPEIDREIERVFPRTITKEWLEQTLGNADFAYDTQTLTAGLAAPIWEFLDRGGKRWRPALTILSCEAVGGTKKRALPFTPLVELIHNGCVTADTLIWKADGTPTAITDIQEGDLVLSLATDYSIVKRPVVRKHENGVKNVVLIKTRNRSIKTTENHPFLVASKQQAVRWAITQTGRIQLESRLARIEHTISSFCEQTYPTLGTNEISLWHMKQALYGYPNCCLPLQVIERIAKTLEMPLEGNWHQKQMKFEKAEIIFEWKEARELKTGDLLVVTKDIAQEHGSFPEIAIAQPHWKDKNKIPREFSLELAQLCGFILGDGSVVADGRTILCLPSDKPGRKEYEKIVEDLFGAKPSLSKAHFTICSKAVVSLFKSLELAKPALEKQIPKWVFKLPRPHRLAFIRGYLDSDGTVNGTGNTIFECGSQKLIIGLKALLDSMGYLTGNVRRREVDNTHFKRKVDKKTSVLYALTMSSQHRVLREIGSEITFYTQRLAQPTSRTVQLRQMEKIPSLPLGFELEQLGFNPIQKIIPQEAQPTFDIEVEETHNYFSNGIVTHNTIMVDDVEDDSKVRRGKPCTHLQFGVDVAVNDANAMYFIPLTLLYNNPYKLDEHIMDLIWNLYGQEMLRVSAGQAMDIWWHHGHKFDVSENEYLQMCSYKTGVLARFSTKLGAILGRANAAQTEALGKFGETVGVAFQIQDDILNLVGEEFQKGKGIGEDIHEGKRTIMVLHSLSHATPADKARLIEILNLHPEDEQTISEAIALIQKTNSIDYARAKARELVKSAWRGVEKTLPASKAKNTLKDFADYLVERDI